MSSNQPHPSDGKLHLSILNNVKLAYRQVRQLSNSVATEVTGIYTNTQMQPRGEENISESICQHSFQHFKYWHSTEDFKTLALFFLTGTE